VKECVRLRVYLEESDQYQGKPTYQFLLNYLKRHGYLGATVYRGLEGFGESNRIHSADLLDVSSSLPIVVEVLESARQVRELKALFKDTGMLNERIVTEEKVAVARF
jgi:PII-like signaling protein